MPTLKESFYEKLGDSRSIEDIINAYGSVNSLSLAKAGIGMDPDREEYLEMYDDYLTNLQHIEGLEDALLEEWDGWPRVLRIGKAIYEEEDNDQWLQMYHHLPSSQRRQVAIIADYGEKKEGWRKDFDFYFRDDSQRNLMILPETNEEDASAVYESLKAMLIKLEKIGGGAAFHFYSGPEDHHTKTSVNFYARPNCIYRIPGENARKIISQSRTPDPDEVFETAPLNLKNYG